MTYWHGKRAIVTGGSAGLGRAVATELVKAGARAMIVARKQSALDDCAAQLRALGGDVTTFAADVTLADDVARMTAAVESAWGGADMLCHCAGRSMRGTALDTPPDEYRALWETNFLAAVRCVQALAGTLLENRGHVVLIGSLASKVATPYVGAYPASKFPLAAFAQQLRLENADRGLHTLLVCPGPIARDDDSPRYAGQGGELPSAAHKPGGGAKLRAIDPHNLARKILEACERRQSELIVPAKARLLFIAYQISPTLGDWLLRKVTPG